MRCSTPCYMWQGNIERGGREGVGEREQVGNGRSRERGVGEGGRNEEVKEEGREGGREAGRE